MFVESLRAYAEAILAATGVLGILKSAYNGFVYEKIIRRLQLAEEAHERTVKMDSKLDQLLEQEERRTDAMIALGRAVNDDDTEFDMETYLSEQDRDGVEDFVADD